MPLALQDFKRPPQDNGRGLCGSAAPGWTGGERGFDHWVAELQALGVKWFRLVDDRGDSLPLCEKLLASGIFPVVRLLRRDPPPNDAPQPNPGHLNPAEEETIKRLIGTGVLYFETNNAPDSAAEWKNGAMPSDPLEAAKLVALNWLFDAHLILAAGGYPALPAVSAVGQIDLMQALVSLDRHLILLDGCWLALHNHALNRPLNYPGDEVNREGRPLTPEQYELESPANWAWWNVSTGRPDSLEEINRRREVEKNTNANASDPHAGFLQFEYLNALARKYLGRSIPILSTEAGVHIGDRYDPRYPRVTPRRQAELTCELFDWMQRAAPDYYFACLPSLMVPSPGREPEAWYGDFWQRAFRDGSPGHSAFPPFPVPDVETGETLPVVAAVKSMESTARVRQAPPPEFGPPAFKPSPPPLRVQLPRARAGYTVLAGDTLATIARKFGTTVTALAIMNNISDPSRVTAGHSLLVPAPSVPATAPESASRPTPPRFKSLAGIPIDPRLVTLGIHVESALAVPTMPYWRLVSAEYLDPEESAGQHHILYTVLDETGAPSLGQRVLQCHDDETRDAMTDDGGHAELPVWGSFSPERGELGSYSAWVDGLPSDRVVGLGLPHNRFVSYRLTWHKTVK